MWIDESTILLENNRTNCGHCWDVFAAVVGVCVILVVLPSGSAESLQLCSDGSTPTVPLQAPLQTVLQQPGRQHTGAVPVSFNCSCADSTSFNLKIVGGSQQYGSRGHI